MIVTGLHLPRRTLLRGVGATIAQTATVAVSVADI